MNKITLLLASITLLTLSSVFLFSTPQLEYIENTNQASNKKEKDSDLCPFTEPDFRSQEKHWDTLNKMKKAFNSDDKLKVMMEEVPKDPKVLSRLQIIDYLVELNFTQQRVDAIQFLNPYIVALSTDDVLKILKLINFSEEKLVILDALKITIHDGTEENKQKLVQHFSFSSDQEKAKKMLEDVNPFQRDCIFGDVTEKVATFVIDVSGSMSSSFKKDDGTTITRLDAVKEHLSNVIEKQLKEYQFFNIVTFESNGRKWKQENVAAVKENIEDALKFVKNMQPGGGTNLDKAFELAFSTSKDLQAIYLLGDGDGSLSSNTIPSYQAKFDPKVKINTTAFMLGGSESQQARRDAIDKLQFIARENNGSFKQFE